VISARKKEPKRKIVKQVEQVKPMGDDLKEELAEMKDMMVKFLLAQKRKERKTRDKKGGITIAVQQPPTTINTPAVTAPSAKSEAIKDQILLKF